MSGWKGLKCLVRIITRHICLVRARQTVDSTTTFSAFRVNNVARFHEDFDLAFDGLRVGNSDIVSERIMLGIAFARCMIRVRSKERVKPTRGGIKRTVSHHCHIDLWTPVRHHAGLRACAMAVLRLAFQRRLSSWCCQGFSQ